MMFGYACSETEDYMPLSLILSHQLMSELAKIRREGTQMQYLRPDSKSQVTIEYDSNNKPISINTIVVSTQHDDFDEEKGNASSNSQRCKRNSYTLELLQCRSVKT